jgi:hypothetical protein
MRSVILAAGLFAALGLSACDSSKTETAAAPAAPKYVGRSQQMYQGQDMVTKVDSGSIKVGKDGSLEMQASGSVPGPGYKNSGFLKRIYAGPPKDGIYEMDVVADAPAPAGAAAPTPIEVKGGWDKYPADHLKGVKFISKTNSVTAMLPAG